MLIKKDVPLPPHWVLDGNAKRCSVCGYPLQVATGGSVDKVFQEHLRKAHQPGQTSEGMNQTAARIVREATEK